MARSPEAFSWAVMVLSSRVVGGDLDAAADLRTMLVRWANANAFSEVQISSDAYFALERTLLPVIIAFELIEDDLEKAEHEQVKTWIASRVAIVHPPSGGETPGDHRLLTASVTAAWGAVSGDSQMLEESLAVLTKVVGTQRADGSIPYEAARGARAALYTRQTLANMFMIAEAAIRGANDVYADDSEIADGLRRGIAYLADIVIEPRLASAYAAENRSPGATFDFTQADLAFLEVGRTQRDALSFLDIVSVRMTDSFGYQRLVLADPKRDDRPLAHFDEFVGGNAGCFWGVR
jgi:poly(beta-D-mannuronate) lyase